MCAQAGRSTVEFKQSLAATLFLYHMVKSRVQVLRVGVPHFPFREGRPVYFQSSQQVACFFPMHNGSHHRLSLQLC